MQSTVYLHGIWKLECGFAGSECFIDPDGQTEIDQIFRSQTKKFKHIYIGVGKSVTCYVISFVI